MPIEQQRRKGVDPVGDLWRDADRQVELWLRRIAEAVGEPTVARRRRRCRGYWR